MALESKKSTQWSRSHIGQGHDDEGIKKGNICQRQGLMLFVSLIQNAASNFLNEISFHTYSCLLPPGGSTCPQQPWV